MRQTRRRTRRNSQRLRLRRLSHPRQATTPRLAARRMVEQPARLPGDALAQFDVALDYPRRDELEVVGTEGRLRLPDPWLCRLGHLELERGGTFERLPADPEGRYGLGDPTDPDNDDAYRIELEAVSAAIEGSATAGFGRTDAVDQAAVIEAVRSAAATGTVVRPPGTAPGTCPA